MTAKFSSRASGANWREQFVLAEITAIVRIGEVGRIVKFLRAHDAQRNGKLAGDGHRLLQFAPRQARRIGQDRQGFVAKDLMRHECQKNRIHPAGIRHQARTVGGEYLLQFFKLVHRQASKCHRFRRMLKRNSGR